MKINLSTDLKTRVGDTAKDARLKNAYVEVKGEQSVVRHRPSARGGVPVGTGTAQGGIGFNISGTDYFIGVWGDTLTNYTGGGTTWDSGTDYVIGDHVSYEFDDYWAVNDNTNSQPPSSDWSDDYVPSDKRWVTSSTSTFIFGNIASDGAQFCVIKGSGSNVVALRSTNGSVWQSATVATYASPIAGVTPLFIYDGAKFVGYYQDWAGNIWQCTSTDAINWTVSAVTIGYSLSSINQIITTSASVIMINSSGATYRSVDGGITFSAGPTITGSPSTNNKSAVVVSDIIYFVGKTGANTDIYKSIDHGVSYSYIRSLYYSVTSPSIIYGGGLFIIYESGGFAATSSCIHYSQDFTRLQLAIIPDGGGSGVWTWACSGYVGGNFTMLAYTDSGTTKNNAVIANYSGETFSITAATIKSSRYSSSASSNSKFFAVSTITSPNYDIATY